MFDSLSRRDAARLTLLAPLAVLASGALPALGQDLPPNPAKQFGTPETPRFGGPDTNITIVAFLDYNCPFCKQSAPHLKALMESDDKVQVMFKDWPILSEASVFGAMAAMAAHKHGQYLAVHEALMAIPGTQASQEQMREALEASQVDMAAVDATLAAEKDQLLDQLRNNLHQADQVKLTGTPSYFIGPYFAAAALDLETFEKMVDAGREAMGI